MFKTVIAICSFYCLIAFEASVVLVKVLIYCVFHDVTVNAYMQEFTRIIGLIHPSFISL